MRKAFAFAGITLLLPLGLVTLIGVGAASAAVVGTGSVTCTKTVGTIKFVPALKNNGVSPETTTVTVTVSGCKTTGSNIKTVTKGAAKATIKSANNSCTGLSQSKPVNLKITWTSSPAASPSTAKFTGYDPVVTPKLGFSLPGTTHTVTVVGSFPGSNGGTSTHATANTTLTAAQFGTKCKTGVSSMKIATGTSTLS